MKTTLKERLREALAGPPKRRAADLARACNIKPPSVAGWLSGKTKALEGSNLLAAAAFLKVNAKWLADGVGPKTPDATETTELRARETDVTYLPEPAKDALVMDLLQLFSQLDIEGKREYLAHLRGFVLGRRPHADGNASVLAG
jgi:hypothetical protein